MTETIEGVTHICGSRCDSWTDAEAYFAFLEDSENDPLLIKHINQISREHTRQRHKRETFGQIGEQIGISRELLRKSRYIAKHRADLKPEIESGHLKVEVAYRAALTTNGRKLPARRCSASTENADDAVRVLLRYFAWEQLANAINRAPMSDGAA